ncbi:uncharacterized protein Z519_12158 [Cladophialophora bantiana CBS 173.52]|uniref:Heterokaryon incompatibility domain-containing protein n=1 Tax=Cladophialophora bantiana (strain ATCC 10958 / CBS 173.52 / CDC B-1940 / NIH 8579) TaxID=1442370 RepID=A0A0D2H8N4_CLAB1|nr:uncharacterized protein Z519_12158 [Cladophialophora bantiana CBS 173.52]KIW87255.1 hypothetical protein Z519_12158 [Cladophialophora bantiana CBS 173.52]
MADNEFQYTPLTSMSQAIRILSMKKSSLTEVECCLEPASLEEDSIYDALSYTWGEPSDTPLIKLNGHTFKITTNLAIGLQYFVKMEAPLQSGLMRYVQTKKTTQSGKPKCDK